MKVLILHRDLGVGSVGKIVEDLYFGVKARGFECKVAYGFKNVSNIPENDLFSVSKRADVKGHALISRVTDRAGFYSACGTKKLIGFIERYNPDVVHIHGCYGYWLNIRLLYRYFAKKQLKIINTLHSCWDFTGHCCYFTRANCDKWKTACHRCPEKRSYPASFFLDSSKRNFLEKRRLFLGVRNMVFVAPSQWMAQCFGESFLKLFPIKVINNGVDLTAFKKTGLNLTKYGIDSSKPIVLGVASKWDLRKGLSDFLALYEVLPKKYQIVLVGLDKKQIGRLPKGIIGISRTDSKEELAGLYSSALVFFNPTYEDNYPTVNLESIACQTPVITYNVGGSPEIVNQLGFGRVVACKDFQTIIHYIDQASTHKPTIDAGRLAYLSKDRMIKEYLNLYVEGVKK